MNEHETHAAVAYEMRESDNEATCPWWADGGDCVHCPMGGAGKNCPFDKFADRLEAAHKREIEKMNSVIQATVSHSDAEIDRLRREAKELRKQIGNAYPSSEASPRSGCPGNGAKLREALKAATVAIEAAKKKMGVDNPIILEIIDAALAKPPRNCDRFGGDIDKLREACARERGLNPEEDFPDVFPDWLLAPSTEKKGGAK